MNIKKITGDITTEAIIEHLKELALLEINDNTDNKELSKALFILAEHLKYYTDYSFYDALVQAENKLKKTKTRRKKRVAKNELPSETVKLNNLQIRKYLDSDTLTKQQLIELGYTRFGIPRSGMQRSNMNEIRDRIMSALSHEDTLDIISDVAKDKGKNRSS